MCLRMLIITADVVFITAMNYNKNSHYQVEKYIKITQIS